MIFSEWRLSNHHLNCSPPNTRATIQTTTYKIWKKAPKAFPVTLSHLPCSTLQINDSSMILWSTISIRLTPKIISKVPISIKTYKKIPKISIKIKPNQQIILLNPFMSTPKTTWGKLYPVFKTGSTTHKWKLLP